MTETSPEQGTNTTPGVETNPAPADEQAEASAESVQYGTEADDNGATKGYLGEDAADIVGAARESDDDDVDVSNVLRNTATAASFRDPVPPGGHPADPTSKNSVGAAADSETALAKAEATRL